MTKAVDPQALLARFVFPLPPIELKANRRMGQRWGGTQSLKSSYRTICDMILLDKGRREGGVTVGSCHIIPTVYLGKGQRCDLPDLGSWCKTPIDALATGGWITTDSAACIKSFTAIPGRDAKNPRVESELREY